MAGVDEASIGVACRAEVPIRAIEALVADTVDVLVTTITDGIVSSVSARGKKSVGNQVEGSILNSWLEGMLWVESMLQADMAGNAQVVVRA